MPSWTIHLAIANKINKKLKLDNDLFYYGNLIPDVDKNSKINRYNAHYYDKNLSFPNCKKENMINISLFLKDYKKKIKNPLILGYYCHLLTDNYFNNEVYTKCWVQDNNSNIIGIKFKNGRIKYIDIEDKKRIKRKYKHKDFELYGKYLYNKNNIELPIKSNIIKNNINEIKGNFLTKKNVNERIKYLNSKFKDFNKLSFMEKFFKHKYKLFNKQDLDIMLDNCVKYILNEIKELGDISE